MLSRLREHFGAAGLVVAVVALVAALAGGAVAANSGSGDSQATASAKKKAKKGPRGPRGPKGAKGDTGPAGPQGPAGPAGAKGDTGAPGAAGAAGAAGAEGATGATGATGPEGPEGLEGELGPQGEAGEEGSPWTAGGTLPSGETLTGAWGVGPSGVAEALIYAPISFPIALAADIPASNTHTVPPSTSGGPDCPGTVGDPQALPGHICVYVGAIANAVLATEQYGEFGVSTNIIGLLADPFAGGTDVAGAFMALYASQVGGQAFGSWAVTAP